VRRIIFVLAVLVVSLTGCATIPTGPSVMVLPGAGKPFDVFQADDGACRDWALRQAGITTEEASTRSTATSAAIGTVMGAALGAAIGAAAGNPGIGAAIGAGTGLLGGTAVGAEAGYASGYEVQRRYDIAYQQCMYAKGNQIPGVVAARPVPPPPPPPPPPSSIKPLPAPPPAQSPPPPGSPPTPPSR
jgi:hypothetical protein